MKTLGVDVVPLEPADHDWARGLLIERWQGVEIVSRGRWTNALESEAIVAKIEGRRLGLLTFVVRGDELEIVTLDSIHEGVGIASTLIHRIVEIGKERGCHAIWTATTNDNLYSMGFYQRRGFRLWDVRRNAVDMARVRKPDIPDLGYERIPLRDEVELRLELDA